jgi:hypothetical protein
MIQSGLFPRLFWQAGNRMRLRQLQDSESYEYEKKDTIVMIPAICS